MTHLNDLSKVYLEQVSSQETQEEGYKPIDKKKENAMYRRAGNLARTSLSSKGKEKEKAQDKSNKIVSAITKQKEDERFERIGKDPKHQNNYKEALDPVGQEDADIDNDGDTDKSDKYLHKRRKAIGKAIDKKKKVAEAVHATAKQMHSPHEVPSKNLKGLVSKAVKRIDTDVDGDTDKNDKAKGELGEFIPGVNNKRLYSSTKTTTAKESFSNWRQDLTEVITDIESKPIKEKKVNNKVTINPKLGEALEEIGATLIEMVEVSEDVVNEAVKGQDTESRKAAAAERKAGDKRLSPSAGKANADKMERDIKFYDKVTKKTKPSVVGMTHEENEIEEGMSMKDFKANRRKLKRREASADAKKRGHVGKEWHNTGRKYSADDAKSNRAKLSDDDRAARHRAAVDPDDDRDENTYSADRTKNPKKLRKQKAMGEETLHEKALSKAQQRFFGMVRATQKGEMENPSPEVAKAASSMSKSDVKDFAKTKHKGLPSKKEVKEGATEAPMSPQELALQKRKTAIDQQIAQKRKQALSKAGQQQQKMNEEESDRMKDKHLERGGMGARVNYDRPPAKKLSNAELGIKPGKTQLQKDAEKKYGKGKSALDIVKSEIRAKHGKGAILGDK